MKAVFAFILLIAVIVNCQPGSSADGVTYNDPDTIFIVGQNDNLTASALTLTDTVQAILVARNWTMNQLTAFYNESRAYYASQFGIYFDDGVNVLGFPNSPTFAVSRDGRAYLNPLIARGKYRVYGVIDNEAIIPFTVSSRQNPPLITLVEYDVLFDFTQVIPGWTFTPFNYTGNFATLNGGPVAVRQYDNLAFGIYNVSIHNILGGHALNYDFYMRTPSPDHTEPVALEISTERGEFCSSVFGAGTSVMRVDAFSAYPNAQGKYPTMTTAAWQFFHNIYDAAVPSLYNFAPKVHPGHTTPSCLATI